MSMISLSFLYFILLSPSMLIADHSHYYQAAWLQWSFAWWFLLFWKIHLLVFFVMVNLHSISIQKLAPGHSLLSYGEHINIQVHNLPLIFLKWYYFSSFTGLRCARLAGTVKCMLCCISHGKCSFAFISCKLFMYHFQFLYIVFQDLTILF